MVEIKTRSQLRREEWQNPEIRAKRLKRSGMLGKKHSLETKEMWSKKRKGIHNSPETEFKAGGGKPNNAYIFPRGNKNPSWSGGIYRTFRQKVMKLPEYIKWRKEVFSRDSHTCQHCSVVGGELHAHHMCPYIRIINDNDIKTLTQAISCLLLWDINNGVTLCKKCHMKTTTYGGKSKK